MVSQQLPTSTCIPHRNLATTSHATSQNHWPLPLVRDIGRITQPQKDFGRAYELGRNAKEDPWCGRPARYVRRRAIHPPSLTTIETSLGHTSLIYAPVCSTTAAHLGPNANMPSPTRTCRSQHERVNPHSTQDECLDVSERTLSYPPADCDALDLY